VILGGYEAAPEWLKRLLSAHGRELSFIAGKSLYALHAGALIYLILFCSAAHLGRAAPP